MIEIIGYVICWFVLGIIVALAIGAAISSDD